MADRRTWPVRRVVPLTNPAAGAEFDLTPDNGANWRIQALAWTLTTSAVAGNRQTGLRATDGNVPWLTIIPSIVQAATSTNLYQAFPGAPMTALSGGAALVVIPDEGIVLPQGFHLRSFTGGLDAGDTYTGVIAVVEEWPSGPYDDAVPFGLWMERDTLVGP